MTNPAAKFPDQKIYSDLQTLMLLRVVAVSILLGALIFVQFYETGAYFAQVRSYHYLLIIVLYALTITYVILLRHYKNLLYHAYAQLLIDVIFVSALIYTTGGIESLFSFLYILVIIYASIILYRKGGMIIASSSSTVFGLLMGLQYYGFIHPLGSRLTYPDEYKSSYLYYVILVNIAAFYLVAYLASYISEQARKSKAELQAKQRDVNKLEILNESIIQSITSGLIVLDGRNRIILSNPAAEKIFNFNSGEIAGEQVLKVLPFLKEHMDDEDAPFLKSFNKLNPFLDLRFSKSENKTAYLRFSVSPLDLSMGDQQGCMLIFQDMTDVKKIEEEMKRVEDLALIGELAAAIAHEIRNPMASISGSIQMMKTDLDHNDFNSRLMDIISREIDRLNNLISDFLNFARPKETALKNFNLNDLILESLELFKNSHHWTGNTKVTTVFPGTIEIESDPEQIRQVFWNLFLNACEAMPQGGNLTVSTDIVEHDVYKNKNMARIVVHDTGPGFDKKALSKIFTPFFTTKERGSGLGLATVKRIINGLKGEVKGLNHAEGGAEITITLPLVPPPVSNVPV